MAAVRRLHRAAARRQTGLVAVEGIQAVRAAVACGGGVQDVFVTSDALGRFDDVIRDASDRGVRLHQVTEAVMEALAETTSPQGIVATCTWQSAPLAQVLKAGRASVILDGVADPGNAGTIIRTADAAGAGGVVMSSGSVDPTNGKCIRSSAGSLFRMPVAVGVSIPDAIEGAHRAGQVVVAATGDAGEDVFAWLADRKDQSPICWVLGTEAHGVSAIAREGADVRVRIPMAPGAESLNVAAAAAVCLYAPIAVDRGRLGAASVLSGRRASERDQGESVDRRDPR